MSLFLAAIKDMCKYKCRLSVIVHFLVVKLTACFPARSFCQHGSILAAKMHIWLPHQKPLILDEAFLLRRPIVCNRSAVRQLSDLTLGYIFCLPTGAKMIGPNGIADQKLSDASESSTRQLVKGRKKPTGVISWANWKLMHTFSTNMTIFLGTFF